MSYLPVKMPSAADTFSNFATYKATVDISSTGTQTLLTTDNNMGQFVVTEAFLYIDSAGLDLKTFTMTMGWNASAYDNIIGPSVTMGTTNSSPSNYFSFQLRRYRYFKLTLRSSSGYALMATPMNTATDIRLNVSSTIMPSGSPCSFFIVGYYSGMRP